MRRELQLVLDNYLNALKEPFASHALGTLIRRTIPQSLEQIVGNKLRYSIKGSCGAGNWTNAPWVGIFDVLITTTAQSGYYPVFLFKTDMSGLYLSLNQGVTEIERRYKKERR